MKQYLVIFALCVSVGFVTSCGKKEGATAEGPKVDSTAIKNKEGSMKWVELANAGKFDEMNTLMDPNYIEHSPAPGQKPGLAGFIEMMKQWKAAYPDMKIETKDMIAEGDKVVTLSHMTGTQTGPFMGKPGNGSKMDVMGVDVVKIVNGKATEHWGFMEEMKWAQQAGMMPSMDQMMAGMKKEEAKKK